MDDGVRAVHAPKMRGGNEDLKRTLLFALATAVIPVGVDAQGTPSASCTLRTCAEEGNADAQAILGFIYEDGDGVPHDPFRG